MCYCCGSILWSRVDNCHTNLVNPDIEEKNIPARAYLKVMCQNNNSEIVLEYRHKSGKLFACTVCKSFKLPSEFNSEMHVGKVKVDGDVLPVHKWDMRYPQEILSLKNQTECCQIKTHNSELRGQEETAIIRETKNTRPLSELFTRKSVKKLTNALVKPP